LPGTVLPTWAPGPMIFGVLLICHGYLYLNNIRRKRKFCKRREMAVALREEKLQAQGLACVRLVNSTPWVVQVRSTARPTSCAAKQYRPCIFTYPPSHCPAPWQVGHLHDSTATPLGLLPPVRPPAPPLSSRWPFHPLACLVCDPTVFSQALVSH
jgi:hypothetical protein